MESYDEVVGFDYTDENEWKNWIREKFLPLHKQLSIILKLRESLENILKTNLKEAFSQRYIQEILLGGITKEGEYTQNSLAKLYKDALGIYINPKEWVAYCRTGLNPVENGIECKFEDTSFLVFITEIKELVEEVLSRIEIEPQDIEDKEIEEIMNSPEKILEIIKEIYKSIVSISANYDYHMFFVLNTRCIPRFFIEKAYPKLKENFEKVAEILELEEKFVPDINDEKVRREYTLIGHKENGFADTLFDVQHTIWNYFNFSRESFYDGEKWINIKEIEEIFSRVVQLNDLWSEFIKKVEGQLHFLEELKFSTVDINITGYNQTLYFVIKNVFVVKAFNGYSPRTTYAFYNEDFSISFTEFMNKIAPYTFVGIILIEPVEKIPYPEVLSRIDGVDVVLKFCNLVGD